MNLINLINKKKSFLILFLATFSLIIPIYNQIENYINFFFGDVIEHFIYVSIILIISFLLTKNNYVKKEILIIYSLSLLLFVGYFTSYISILINLYIILVIFCLGSFIFKKLSKSKFDMLKVFCLGYGSVSFFLYTPYLIFNINLRLIYLVYFLILTTFSFFYIFKNKSKIIYEYKKIKNIEIEYIFLSLITFIILSSSITDFLWDELNSGIFYPLKAIVLNSNPLKPELPTSLTFTSAHFISFLTFEGFLANVKDYELVYFYKHFQAILYIISFFFLYNITQNIFPEKLFSKLSFYIISTSSLWYFQITGNLSDFPVFLLCIYSIKIFINTNSIYKITNFKLNYIDLIIFGLFFSISVKCVVVIFTLVILDMLNNFQIKRIISYSICGVFFFPVMIRNYLLTNNPFFPQFNNFFKSDFFPYDLQTGAIGAKWLPSWPIDWTLMMNFFSNSNESLKIFAHPHEFLYSPVFYALFIFCLLIFYFRLGQFKNNSFIIAGGIIFFSTVFLINAEVRYLKQAYIFFVISLVLILKNFNLINSIYYKSFFFKILLIFMIALFPISNFSGSDMYISEKKIFSKKGKNWEDKITFYDSISPFLHANLKEDEKIFIHYLQDKIFLVNFTVIENDWYNHHDIKSYRKIWESNLTQNKKIEASQEYFCEEKNIKYLILSYNLADDFNPIVERLKNDNDHYLYRVKCKNE